MKSIQNSVYNEIQMAILGQRKEKITPVETNRFLQLPITEDFLFLLSQSLQKKILNPDITILQIIPLAKTKEYLLPLSLCIRNGADTNMYVDVPKMGNMHILGYIYNSLGGDKFSGNNNTADQDVLTLIILMFMASGARTGMAMFDKNGGHIKDGIQEKEPASHSISVVEWLSDQGVSNILDVITTGNVREFKKIIDDEDISFLSFLLDRVDLMPRDYENSDIFQCIKFFSNKSLDNMIYQITIPKTLNGLDYKTLVDSVKYINYYTFDTFVKAGSDNENIQNDKAKRNNNRSQLPSYLLINKILIMMKTFRGEEKILAMVELEKMLISSINAGVELDNEQLTLISTLGKDVLDNVKKEYEQPYWKKVCRLPSSEKEVPSRLKKLAASLNIDPGLTQSSICEAINSMSKADKEALKEAAKKRQQQRMNSNLGSINEFLNNRNPNLVCRNRSVMKHDPTEYSDLDVAYYKDEQGAIWCFGSDLFSSLLETGMNPYNMTLLPYSFKDQINHQLTLLKRLGMSDDSSELINYSQKIPVPFAQSIDSLNNNDVISDNINDGYLNTFISLAARNGLTPENIKILSKDNIMSAFRAIHLDIDLLPLSTSHALITTARIIHHVAKSDDDSVNIFFSTLKNLNKVSSSFYY